MSAIKDLIKDLVAANRILSHEEVCDAYGHISFRSPENPNRYFLSRSRSPGMVTADDIREFELDGTPIDDDGTPIYIERPIHGAVYMARPEVQSVVHNHSLEILPFTITKVPLRLAIHSARSLGHAFPVWDIRDKFGDTDLLVTTMEQGNDLATAMAENTAVLMRGHGCTVAGESIQKSVQHSIMLQRNAEVQQRATALGGEITYLSPGEISAPSPGAVSLKGHDRAWEYLCQRAGASE
jgi:ribulose-5-phosphate 4-epimerase/fuculose-1-phosphate aldolase